MEETNEADEKEGLSDDDNEGREKILNRNQPSAEALAKVTDYRKRGLVSFPIRH